MALTQGTKFNSNELPYEGAENSDKSSKQKKVALLSRV